MEHAMSAVQKVAIVTGASKGIGAGLVTAFLERGYAVVANSRNIVKDNPFADSDSLVLVEGDIAESGTAARITEAALARFGRIDVLANNAGIYISNSFIDFTVEELRALYTTNVEGFFFITQLVIKQLVAQKFGGSIVTITSSLADHPIAGVNSAVPMLFKGGLEATTRSLALEYVNQGIRVNAVAPGIVDTPMHKDDPHDFLKTLQPMGRISSVGDIVDAVLYLTDAGQVTGEVLRVDGGSHVGRW
jgi:NAD(P)-dependent dehydrogenase (short-subunit alcohol dehydrogenase family)